MNILVPMDFTEVSLNSLDYALLRFPDVSITVIHVLSGILEIDPTFYSAPNGTKDSTTRDRLEKMIVQHLNLDKIPEHIRIEIYHGEVVNVIHNYLKTHLFDILVIGSRDKFDLFDKLFGTTCLGLVKRTTIPTFVIPRLANYIEKDRKILIAADERIIDHDILLSLKYWNPNNALIKFLHIHQNKSADYLRIRESILKKLYEEVQPPFAYEIEEKVGVDVVDSLLKSAHSYKADLMIIIARNTTFLKSLFYKSTSKDLILKSALPMLFLHDGSNSSQHVKMKEKMIN